MFSLPNIFRPGAGLLGLLCLLLLHIFYYYPHYVDDSFISLHYARHLLEGRGLTWNGSDYVEGYSNLLWVLLIAGLGGAGFDLESASKALGLICTLGAGAAFISYAHHARISQAACAFGLLAYAASAPVAIWAMGGMESPLVLFLWSWAIVLTCRLFSSPGLRITCAAGLCLGLLCLTRPEGPIYTMAVAAGLLVSLPLPLLKRLRTITALSIIPLLFFCTVTAWRLHYYGQWTPNSAMAKVAFTSERLDSGLHYIGEALLTFSPLLLYSLIALRGKKPPLPVTRFLSVTGLLWCAALVAGGGDFFEGFRLFLPAVPIIILLFMYALHAGGERLLRKELAFIALILFCHGAVQFSHPRNAVAKTPNWMEDGKALGLILKSRFGKQQPLIATGSTGVIPYYSQLPTLDVLGLNDAELVERRHANPLFGRGLIGHDLFDAAYVKSRKPDVLVFHIPGISVTFCQFMDCKDLLAGYVEETIHVHGKKVTIHIRKGSALLSK